MMCAVPSGSMSNSTDIAPVEVDVIIWDVAYILQQLSCLGCPHFFRVIFRDIQQILQPSRHRVLNLVFVKTQSCLGRGQTWAPRQATPFVAVSAPVSAPMPRRRPNQDKNGIFHYKNLPYSNKINDSDQKNGAVASGHGPSTVFILQIAAKQEKNEPANSRFGFSFFIVAFFCCYFFLGAGVKPFKIQPCHPFLFIASDAYDLSRSRLSGTCRSR